MDFTDCTTEQQIPRRPVDNNKRMTFYLGKKKRDSVKTQLMANDQGIVIHKLRHKKGQRKYDYSFYQSKRALQES